MSDKILMITAPDDSYLTGVRIFIFDLLPNQYSIFTQSLLSFDTIPSVIIYNSSISTDTQWLLDKILKSDLIFFNAESENQQMVGYLCAHLNSYYFGELRSLSAVNKSVIFDVHQLEDILKRKFEKYGKF